MTTPMNHFDRLDALKRKGITQASIASSLEPPVRSATLSLVLAGKSVSARIRRKVAEVIGKPFEVVWGEEDRTNL